MMAMGIVMAKRRSGRRMNEKKKQKDFRQDGIQSAQMAAPVQTLRCAQEDNFRK
ncbi:hypothetical protein KIN20_033754 [Parelaphostrongylus tenuis]|uniref:Uncharacterized protein n=1 Tax=Parelaphostrongylus tenuis TaxID=148309 RepID=A0AAD5WJH4_PARTN|nr:hypothetical protein KIN20_033754 [Parelaphostrongylus tenuis]